MIAGASYAHFETSSGAQIHRVRLQAFPKFWAYAYIVQKKGGTYLIDCGSGTDTSHEDLILGLRQAGLQPSDLTHILLTHAHIDHYGGLSKLKPLTNARIGCHELDLQTVAHHEARLVLIGRRLASFLGEAGLTDQARDALLGMYRFTKAIYCSTPVDFTYGSQNMQVGEFELVHLPGHCPGQVALRLDDVVFCGDMVVEGVTPHVAPEVINPYSGLDHYLDSLVRFQAWAQEARLVFNGHDEPITDLSRVIEAIHANIFHRMSRAVQALHEPLTIAGVCEAVYGAMGGYNQLLVNEKTGAYAEFLYEHGMIEIANPDEMERGLPARYCRNGEEVAVLAVLEKKIKRTYSGC